MSLITSVRSAAMLCLSTAALGGCLGNSGSPAPPPTNVQAFAGDASVSVAWQGVPGVTYWLFYAQDPTISPASLNSATPVLNVGAIQPASSPTILCSPSRIVVNNDPPVYSYFPPFYFSLNGRTGTAPGGASSAPISAAPRPAGGPGVPWVAGSSMNAAIHKLAYVPITGCGAYSRPAEGLYLAVGASGAIYTSLFAPGVAGALTNPGNSPMTWTAGTVSVGSTPNLNGVAGRSVGLPGANTVTLVAVGDYGTLLYSIDGQHWSPSPSTPTTANLNDVAFAGGAFVAVGDGGTVITSTDGINWAAPSTNNAASVNPAGAALRALHCAPNSATCVAVGDNGTILFTANGGSIWSSISNGSNNWIGVAYGNADTNFDNVVSVSSTGTAVLSLPNIAINTWVVVDAQGNYIVNNNATGGLGVAATWLHGQRAIAPNIVAIDYSSNFVAIDASGNSWINETAAYGTWATNSAAPIASQSANAVSMVSNGYGFVAVAANGNNAANF
jgi:photosystem II stability/assembly factor-like uncharacterized protein